MYFSCGDTGVRHHERCWSRVQQFGIKVEQVDGAAAHNDGVHVSTEQTPVNSKATLLTENSLKGKREVYCWRLQMENFK